MKWRLRFLSWYRKSPYMRKVTVSRMREIYSQTVLTFRITYVLAVILQNYFFQTYRGYEKAAQSYAVRGLRGWFGCDVHHSVPNRSGNNNDADRKFVKCSNYVVRYFTTHYFANNHCSFLFLHFQN